MGSERKNFFEKLRTGLAKTRDILVKNIDNIVLGEKVIDQELFEELEEALITSDVGPTFTHDLIEKMKERVKRKELNSPELLKSILRDHMGEILRKNESPLLFPPHELFSIMVVGVNGTGKTTTIGKMAYGLKEEGRSVLLAAADTFRAAAIEQLEVWSQRVGCPLVKQKPGTDPSAVVFDALQMAKSNKIDTLIVDTAGRLHTRVNLMEELKKMKRIMGRELPGSPHEIFLVLDATTGQ
ncbi:MAG: signaling recognition particle receptor family protein, partial [Syntrophales bacterium]|nr:signaling recognition particle receptor family protein [Syntrophales bacterium]